MICIKINSKMSNAFYTLLLSFFRVILIFLHFTYSVIQYVDIAQTFLMRNFKTLLPFREKNSQRLIMDCVVNLEKSPSHLVIILGTEKISLQDFNNLITWCSAANIQFVTFYDCYGKFIFL